eukprot:c11934_g1_i1.p1 GENE.c11934_g1_i1~~c11934_g1_i1.p1  ORF type:complete len:353 (-),score=81.20 c11934_g1_i1:45-1103(-)
MKRANPATDSVLNIVVVGSGRSGKTSICSRLVSHSFDAYYTPTTKKVDYFMRTRFANNDRMLMLEDTCAVELVSASGILNVPWWFQQWPDERAYDSDDEDLSLLREDKNAGPTSPVYQPHKRYGAFVVFDLASKDSLHQATQLLTDIFISANGFAPMSWKPAPIAVILVGNKCDLIGAQREVQQSDIDSLIDFWTNPKILNRKTREPRRHIKYMEVSAKHGTNCENLVPMALEAIATLPSRATVLVPEMDNWYGTLLKKSETVREIHGFVVEDVFPPIEKSYKFAKSQLHSPEWVGIAGGYVSSSGNWVAKYTVDKIPESAKIIPYSKWVCCCWCLMKKPKETEPDDDVDDA